LSLLRPGDRVRAPVVLTPSGKLGWPYATSCHVNAAEDSLSARPCADRRAGLHVAGTCWERACSCRGARKGALQRAPNQQRVLSCVGSTSALMRGEHALRVTRKADRGNPRDPSTTSFESRPPESAATRRREADPPAPSRAAPPSTSCSARRGYPGTFRLARWRATLRLTRCSALSIVLHSHPIRRPISS
jgi:hypothetical protein